MDPISRRCRHLSVWVYNIHMIKCPIHMLIQREGNSFNKRGMRTGIQGNIQKSSPLYWRGRENPYSMPLRDVLLKRVSIVLTNCCIHCIFTPRDTLFFNHLLCLDPVNELQRGLAFISSLPYYYILQGDRYLFWG